MTPNLLEALKLEKEFQGQMDEYASEASNASNGLLGAIATVGYNGVGSALAQVVQKEHEDEAELSAATVGLILGIFLIRTRKRGPEAQEVVPVIQ